MNRDPIVEIERARSALWSLDPGSDRDTWVKICMATKACGLDFGEFLSWSAGAGNHENEADCHAVWKSCSDGNITASTLFYLARQNGWTDEHKPRQERTQSHQKERPQAEPSKPPLYDAITIWDACKPATDEHGYILQKRGSPDGLKVYSGNLKVSGQSCNGALVLPCRTLSGELASLQFVTGGGKFFLPGCKLPDDGCLIIGGSIENGNTIYIVEGIGQAWAATKATGCTAVVCFGWGRVSKVAAAIAAKFPTAKLVIVPDKGKESHGEAIAKSINGAWCEMPEGSPNNFDINDLLQSAGIEAVRSLLERAKSPPMRYRLLTPADLGNLPPVQWRIKGVLPDTGIGAIFGASGSGKSFITIDLLACVASGEDWFNRRVKPSPVLYVALEGEAGISQRVKTFEAKHGPMASGFRFMLQPLDIRNAGDRADLVKAIKAAGWNGGVICLDTLNRAAPGMDENDSKSMGEVISAAKVIQAELGGMVLLVHHTGKDSTKGMRGHSSLHAALDCAIEVCRDGDRREWKVAKSKDGEDGASNPFRLDVVELDTDDDGEPVTSCVIVPEENAGDAVRRALPPKSGNQRIIWDALGALFLAEGKRTGGKRPEGAPEEVPFMRPCLSLDAAIDGTRTRLVCDAKRQTERTQAAITGLINRGLLELREGWLWCA